MTRTSTVHERVVDALDDLIAHSFACEAELARGPGLNKLWLLGTQAQRQVQESGFPTFIGAREVKSGTTRIINTLQSAIRAGRPPEPIDFASAWCNKPAVLTGEDLIKNHRDHWDLYVSLLVAVGDRLDQFPTEAKAFISNAQVAAVIRALAPCIGDEPSLPVHIDTLASLAHQAFLDAQHQQKPSTSYQSGLHELIMRYFRQAEKAFVAMVEADFVNQTVRQLFSQARDIEIDIDQYYPWGALYDPHIEAQQLLDLYARLNAAGVIKDGKFRLPEKATPEALGSNPFLEWAAWHVPMPLPNRTPDRLYFNTDSSDIRIDGGAIQKHALMKIRYDQPVKDLPRCLRHFGSYVIRQRTRYCIDAGMYLESEEQEMAKRFGRDVDQHRKRKRIVLHDKSSVLGHVVALFLLQLQRDPTKHGKSMKALQLTIYEHLGAAGFRYSHQSIRSSCEARMTTIEMVLRELARLAG